MKRKVVLTLMMGLTCSSLLMGCNKEDLGKVQSENVTTEATTEAVTEETTEAATDEETTNNTESENITADDTNDVADNSSDNVQNDDAGDSSVWKAAYKEKIEECNKEDSDYLYSLCYIDEDNVPELVVDNPHVDMSIYTYSDGAVHVVMENEGYGLGGRPFFCYEPYKNHLGYDSFSGGIYEGHTYLKMGERKEIEEIYSISKDFVDDNGEYLYSLDSKGHWKYIYKTGQQSTEISEDEYNEKVVNLSEIISGEYESSKMLEQLK